MLPNILQFTYWPLGQYFAFHLLASRETFYRQPTSHHRKHFTIHLFATRENILQFTYSHPEKTLCSSFTRGEHLFVCAECTGGYIGMCRAYFFASGWVRVHAIGMSQMSRPKPIGTSGTRWRLSPLAWQQFPIA